MFLKEVGKLKQRLLDRFHEPQRPDPDWETNGEFRFLSLAAGLPELAGPGVILDVGANVGEWTAAAVDRFGPAGGKVFHCVEPIPDFAETIRARHGARGDVFVHETLLSDAPAEDAPIYAVGGGGRMYPPRASAGGGASTKQVRAFARPKRTGDDLLREIGAPARLIKIDCDGHDWFVLSGLRETLRADRPLVQFEYCDFWLTAGARLRDACRLLAALDYATFYVYPDHLRRFAFGPLHETFTYKNLVAAPREWASFAADRISLPARA